MKTELKQAFLQNYTPGNYTDEEFGEMASEFEKDLDELLDEVSKNKCDSCMWSYHNKNSKGYHDVEEYYKDDKEQEEQQ